MAVIGPCLAVSLSAFGKQPLSDHAPIPSVISYVGVKAPRVLSARMSLGNSLFSSRLIFVPMTVSFILVRELQCRNPIRYSTPLPILPLRPFLPLHPVGSVSNRGLHSHNPLCMV